MYSPTRSVTAVDELENLVGTRPRLMMMKSISALDEGSRQLLAASPVAGFGSRDASGAASTTVIGGTPGFTAVRSPNQISVALPEGHHDPAPGTAASLSYLLPGVGETLRVNGTVVDRAESGVTLRVEEIFTHCAKCILRSGLWELPEAPTGDPGADPTAGPLADAAITAFLAAVPFLFISSWSSDGTGDTSPRGDGAGFVRVLDGWTLAVPDRKGNRRTDTFHNLMSCDQVSLIALVPGRDDVLHLTGTALVTDDSDLVATMALDGRPPKAALVVRVEQAGIAPNHAVRESQLWSPASHVDPSTVPDMTALSARHLAANQDPGASGRAARAAARSLSGSPGRLLRRVIDRSYRSDLHKEGYRGGR